MQRKQNHTEAIYADDSEGEAMSFEEQKIANIWHGCLFVLTGHENRVASAVEMRWPGIRVRAVSAVKRRSQQGVKRLSVEVIMPGYVFFEAEENFIPTPPYPDGVIRFLTTVDGEWKLMGKDDEFAQWLLAHDGVLNLSQAHKEGERIVIHKGPLKELEGYILKIDRRNENALVQLEAGSKEIKAWLPFEIVDEEI